MGGGSEGGLQDAIVSMKALISHSYCLRSGCRNAPTHHSERCILLRERFWRRSSFGGYIFDCCARCALGRRRYRFIRHGVVCILWSCSRIRTKHRLDRVPKKLSLPLGRGRDAESPPLPGFAEYRVQLPNLKVFFLPSTQMLPPAILYPLVQIHHTVWR
jgi:hypothetical protein